MSDDRESPPDLCPWCNAHRNIIAAGDAHYACGAHMTVKRHKGWYWLKDCSKPASGWPIPPQPGESLSAYGRRLEEAELKPEPIGHGFVYDEHADEIRIWATPNADLVTRQPNGIHVGKTSIGFVGRVTVEEFISRYGDHELRKALIAFTERQRLKWRTKANSVHGEGLED